ncbi:hypothetical protein MRB53_042006 [Persea americana]|nr:hypothetical protein MRB53_042006 [Persea americana]
MCISASINATTAVFHVPTAPGRQSILCDQAIPVHFDLMKNRLAPRSFSGNPTLQPLSRRPTSECQGHHGEKDDGAGVGAMPPHRRIINQPEVADTNDRVFYVERSCHRVRTATMETRSERDLPLTKCEEFGEAVVMMKSCKQLNERQDASYDEASPTESESYVAPKVIEICRVGATPRPGEIPGEGSRLSGLAPGGQRQFLDLPSELSVLAPEGDALRLVKIPDGGHERANAGQSSSYQERFLIDRGKSSLSLSKFDVCRTRRVHVDRVSISQLIGVCKTLIAGLRNVRGRRSRSCGYLRFGPSLCLSRRSPTVRATPTTSARVFHQLLYFCHRIQRTGAMADSQVVMEQTLLALEDRLRRISFVVHGDPGDLSAHTRAPDTQQPPPKQLSAPARLRSLERSLQHLAAKSYAVSDILAVQQQHPDLFHAAAGDAAIPPTTLPLASLAELILAHNQLYQTSLAQLNHVQDAGQIPDSAALSKLIPLQSRIAQLEERQELQAQRVAELRARSAAVVEKWYEVGVLDMGERWADWEERLRDCEILVRRKEAAKKREDGSA